MDFLGVGPLELLVILIIALIVVGPERLPQIAQSIGKTVRDLRAMSQGFTTEWQRELTLASGVEVDEGLQQSLTKPLKEAQADIQRALTAPLTSPSGTTVEPIPPQTPPSTPNTPSDDADHADT
jgi:sec-independent protein translocase protein TatB